MCDRWRDDFATFLSDMGPRPDGYTLGRIDNDGAYSPENCRWETMEQQARNTRRTLLIAFHGETLTLGAWSTKLGIDESALYWRLREAGWSIKRTLTTPSTPPKGENHPSHTLTDADVTAIRVALDAGQSQGALSRQYGVSQSHISRIYRRVVRA